MRSKPETSSVATSTVTKPYAKLPNKASTINPMSDRFLTALEIYMDDVLK